MDLNEILKSLKAGNISVAEAEKLISLHSIEEIGEFAKIDIGRQARRGIPEVILAETKDLEQIKTIIKKTLEISNHVLVSRIKKDDQQKIIDFAKEIDVKIKVGIDKDASTILLLKKSIKPTGGKIGIVAAGTSDIKVAEEAKLMCESMGCTCTTHYDVGVAGMHRVLPVLKDMIKEDVDCIIVVAGMEGALATLVASIINIPVIGVPTSIGYGYGQKGTAALASMLQSCSTGLAVVNIDNGIAAGGMASNIANRIARKGNDT